MMIHIHHLCQTLYEENHFSQVFYALHEKHIFFEMTYWLFVNHPTDFYQMYPKIILQTTTTTIPTQNTTESSSGQGQCQYQDVLDQFICSEYHKPFRQYETENKIYKNGLFGYFIDLGRYIQKKQGWTDDEFQQTKIFHIIVTHVTNELQKRIKHKVPHDDLKEMIQNGNEIFLDSIKKRVSLQW